MKKILIYFLWCLLSGMAIVFGSQYYRENYGISYLFSLSDNLSAIRFNNGKFAIKNESGGEIVGRKYDYLFNTTWWEREVFVVVKDGLRGYISAQTGELIAEPQYQHAWINGENSNLAACIDRAGKLGFIDIRTGETVIPHKFDCDIGKYNYFEYVFQDNLWCIIRNSEYKSGMIDTLGNVIVPMMYDKIECNRRSGFIKVTSDDSVGLLDFDTKDVVLPLKYDDIHFDYEYGASVYRIIANRNDSTFLLDENFIPELVLEGTWRYIEELEAGYIKAYDDDRWTCIFDKSGTAIYYFTDY